MTELHLEPEEYFESLGFINSGQYEWLNKNNWNIEFLGSEIRPNMWRIDDGLEGHQMIFLDIETKEQLELVLKLINVNEQN